ncbi:alpha-glucoside transport system substrate-binding protein [Actinoalloteichus hoggarensis]|uniref:Bacterial extracellular solute-binding protein n=1 Tax=Actinoalloteichus hoggarensis TaxID=1470176 RepID=A0A221W0V6_9PSEU|nr:ABC transporter substrate-binding protein [Actinoalloteichus hoggarensis]ASO19181.1 Bacterial extracellular solute-binding protein [Actinoalloteichus hoggarensis]MBB5920417.1 alpha-glucoside transport system substrate-binding protein [Actinoalloteichus hoggarensis]
MKREMPCGADGARRVGVSRRVVLGALALPFGALACTGPIAGCSAVTGSLRVAVTWSGRELASFRRVLDVFSDQHGVGTEIVPMGDDIAAALGERPVGAPDVIMLPRPGLLRSGVASGSLLPLEFDDDAAPEDWRAVMSVDGRRYGLPFKIAHKSCVWYRPQALADLGVAVPTTWAEWITLNATLTEEGRTPLALGAADGWVLTDFFENVLLGVDSAAYRALTKTGVGWVEDGVQEALRRVGTMWGAPYALAGGAVSALATQLDEAVLDVFARGEAVMTTGSDFVYSVIAEHGPTAHGQRWQWDLFPFPRAEPDGPAPLVIGGDVAVVTTRAPQAATDLVEWLAGAEAAAIWAGEGGFLSLRTDLPDNRYRHPRLARLAGEVRDPPDGLFFDLSDQLGARGSRLWGELQRFLREVEGADARRVARLAWELGERMDRPVRGGARTPAG